MITDLSTPASIPRRVFLRSAIGAAAASGLASPVFAQGTSSSPATTPPAMLSFPPVKQVEAGLLSVGYVEIGRTQDQPVILLHGWPYDIHSFMATASILAGHGYRVIIPHLRGFGTTRFLSEASLRNGQPAALAMDAVAFMDALAIPKAILGGFDWGARTADIVAALWPERCAGLVSVSGYLMGSQAAGKLPLPPEAELQWWYQFYFSTERGRQGYEKYRDNFAKLIWRLASPRWNFDDATFNLSARSFDNPDHVQIVIHNYRWRLGLAGGEAKYDDIERQIAQAPQIYVPTFTLEGDANGAPHPDAKTYASKFTGPYRHLVLTGGIGHNPPQEAPAAFADAIRNVTSLA